MIIGTGQLAKEFQYRDTSNCTIFASGVSNSCCIDKNEFDREEDLLLKHLSVTNNVFVYFSSCALSGDHYKYNPYYEHKLKMETHVKNSSNNYLIIRLPQVFGEIKTHNTLTNFIYNKILREESFTIYNNAYRYLIDIEDIPQFVLSLVNHKPYKEPIDFANPYSYSLIEIVSIMEVLMGKKAKYSIASKSDQYLLDFKHMELILEDDNLDFAFGIDYFKNKFNKYVQLEQNKS